MGMALLRRMKKGGGKVGGPSLPPGEKLPPEEVPLPMPMLAPPAPKPATHHAAGPVVHIHIGPNSPDAESPAEDLGESPAAEAAEGVPPPMLLQKLHDKIQAARRAGGK